MEFLESWKIALVPVDKGWRGEQDAKVVTIGDNGHLEELRGKIVLQSGSSCGVIDSLLYHTKLSHFQR
jgi:hypothetical protein